MKNEQNNNDQYFSMKDIHNFFQLQCLKLTYLNEVKYLFDDFINQLAKAYLSS